MVPSAIFILIVLIGLTRTNAAVTNEDIRVAILQIVNVVRSTDDKLERHEYRDRAVGEQLKKGMINIDKRIKMLDPLKGTVGRLDERLAAVETILMQKNEREKMQLQRTYEAVIDIQKNLPVIMEEMKNDIISKITAHEPPAQITEPAMSKKDFEKMGKEVMNKMDKITNSIGKIETELPKLKEDSKQVKDLHNKSSDNLEKIKKQMSDNQQVLTKYDKKLSEYNNKIPNISTSHNKEQEEWKQNVLKALDGQKSNVKDILQDIKDLQNQVKQLPQKDDVNNIHRTTLNKLSNASNCQDPSIKQSLNNMIIGLNRSRDETMKNINGLTDLTATLMKSFASTNNALDGQKSNVKEIQLDIKNLQNQLKQLPQKDDVTNVQRTIHNLESSISHNRQDPSIDAMRQTLKDIIVNMNNTRDDSMKNINGLTVLTATLMKSFANTNNVLENQKTNVNEVLQDIKKLQNQINQFPHKDDVTNAQRMILNKLEEILKSNRNPSTDELKQALNNIHENVNNSREDTARNINGLTEITATMMKSFANTNNALDNQKTNVNEVLQDIKKLQTQINQLPQKADVTNTQQVVLHKLEEILRYSRNSSMEDIRQALDNININVNNSHDDTAKNINGLTGITATLMKSFANTNNAIDVQNSDIKDILRDVTSLHGKVNQLPQKGDLFAVQQTTLKKFEEVCRSNGDDMQKTLNEMNTNINKNHDDTAKNFQNLTDVTANLMKNVATNYAFNGQKSDVKEILMDVKNLQNQVNQLPQKYDLAIDQNKTLQKLEKLSTEMSGCQNQSVDKIQKTLDEINNNINQTHEDTVEKLNDLSEITVTLGDNFVTNFGKIRTEIHGLNGLDQMMIKTADSVIDTKRRMEFGVHQILAEISKHTKETAKNVQHIINDRLELFEQSLLDEENGALVNVTSKIEEDIHQLWRQIGVMYQQMSSNSEVLKQLQNQTDEYINGSLGTMNNMKGKVGQITGRITEVDENLNYLLGRLSLVTQEFSRIKSGLTSALEQIKASFQTVQEKINEGPGPHRIPDDEVPDTA